MATIATNVLALPLVTMKVRVHNTESWVDSIKYLVGPNGDAVPSVPQLDLRGINFAMEVRRHPEDHEVLLSASTDDGKLMIGEPPDFGFLIIQIPFTEMERMAAGKYFADIRASDGDYVRVAIEMDLEIAEGITR